MGGVTAAGDADRCVPGSEPERRGAVVSAAPPHLLYVPGPTHRVSQTDAQCPGVLGYQKVMLFRRSVVTWFIPIHYPTMADPIQSKTCTVAESSYDLELP